MSFSPLVSCIIPVYNAEKYLDQGVLSLLDQTYKNIEIILVDDHSTDSSWGICQSYANKHSNVLAFRNENNSGGPLRGRERGIKEAHGEWITFMDCDDYVKAEYVKNLVTATHEGKYDIAVTGHSRMYSDNTLEDFAWENYSQTTAERLSSFYKHFLAHNFWTDPCDTVGQNLIRASICKETNLSKYSNLVYAEDTLMALAFLANSKNGVNFVDNHDFIWRQIEGSGSNGGFSNYADQGEFAQACFDIFHNQDIYNVVNQESAVVSVIIPVYNVEKYLDDCLNSITNQTYRNLEIIVVNDGTTDQSQEIIDKYRKDDYRIIAIKQKNKGLNMARAAGVGIATGEYIAFVDSDDIVHEDYIKIMYETLLYNDVDISVSGFRNFNKRNEVNEKVGVKTNYSEQILKTKSEVVRYYLGEVASVENVHQMTAWGKLYRAQIVKQTDWELSNYRRNEDNLESLQWYCSAIKGIAVMSTQLYYYRSNPNSITGTMQNNVSPEGKVLNYFEFIYDLYGKIKKYLNDDSFDVAVLNQFAHTNRIQTHNYFLNGQLDNADMKSAVDNWGELIDLYNQQIQLRHRDIQQREKLLTDIYNSSSWRITKPLRVMKRFVMRYIR